MYNGYTESPEKIAKRKARICADVVPDSVVMATEAKPRPSFDDLLQMIEQARGALGIRKLYPAIPARAYVGDLE